MRRRAQGYASGRRTDHFKDRLRKGRQSNRESLRPLAFSIISVNFQTVDFVVSSIGHRNNFSISLGRGFPTEGLPWSGIEAVGYLV
jgi:hypothetical protein